MHSEYFGEVMREKEGTAAGKKRKQAVMDEILTPCPVKSAESSMKDSQKSGPKGLDAKIASFFMKMALLSIQLVPQVLL